MAEDYVKYCTDLWHNMENIENKLRNMFLNKKLTWTDWSLTELYTIINLAQEFGESNGIFYYIIGCVDNDRDKNFLKDKVKLINKKWQEILNM